MKASERNEDKLLLKLLLQPNCAFISDGAKRAFARFAEVPDGSGAQTLKRLTIQGYIAADYGLKYPSANNCQVLQLTARGYDKIRDYAIAAGVNVVRITRPPSPLKPLDIGFELLNEEELEPVPGEEEAFNSLRPEAPEVPLKPKVSVDIKKLLPRHHRLEPKEFALAQSLLTDCLMSSKNGLAVSENGAIESSFAKKLEASPDRVLHVMRRMKSDGLILYFAMHGTVYCVALPESKKAFDAAVDGIDGSKPVRARRRRNTSEEEFEEAVLADVEAA